MVIVFNPAAGRRRAHLLWRVLDPLMASGVRLEIVETTRRGDARVLARDAAAKGARLVVAAGGDGTIAEVSNGLIGTDAALGVIPLGTANVLAHEIGLPFLPTAIAAASRASTLASPRRVVSTISSRTPLAISGSSTRQSKWARRRPAAGLNTMTMERLPPVAVAPIDRAVSHSRVSRARRYRVACLTCKSRD